MRVRSFRSLTFLFIYIPCTGGRGPYSLTAVAFPRLVLKVRTQYDSIMVEVKLLLSLVLNPGEMEKKTGGSVKQIERHLHECSAW